MLFQLAANTLSLKLVIPLKGSVQRAGPSNSSMG
jgi:hypothetical protein